MRVVRAHDFESFREVARDLVAEGVRPGELSWHDPQAAQAALFGLGADASAPPGSQHPQPSASAPRVPRRYVELAELAVLFRSDDRFALPYRVLFRLAHGEPRLLEDELDDDVRALVLRVQSVRKDEHRMHAFVRFRSVLVDAEERFVAWFRPEHHIVRLGAPFFARRFAAMHWSILTPDESAHWDGSALGYGPGAARDHAPSEDALEELFRTYYAATYNPARANPALMQKHIPRAFARHMPELAGVPMWARPDAATKAVSEDAAAAALVPQHADWATLRDLASSCRACPAGELGGQTVFGEGALAAKLCLIGEQPGDEEDRAGRPFVGPAGRLLDRALAAARVPRAELYVTNAVKHFSFVWRGKRRLHAKPSLRVVRACRPWLDAELAAVRPEVILCLGATAAQSFIGPRFSITRNRGRVFETPWARAFIVTYHPSAILRMDDDASQARAFEELVADLRLAYELAGQAVRAAAPRHASAER